MSRTLLHDWESSIEKNKNDTEELLKIAEDIYNTAYARGKNERPQGEWIKSTEHMRGTITTIYKCSECGRTIATMPNRLVEYPYCHCGADMKGGAE